MYDQKCPASPNALRAGLSEYDPTSWEARPLILDRLRGASGHANNRKNDKGRIFASINRHVRSNGTFSSHGGLPNTAVAGQLL